MARISATYVNTTTGDATNFGDLTVSRSYLAATSAF